MALITGASSGIGAAFARKLAGAGFRLILVARRGERLEKLASGLPTACEPLIADLSWPEDRRRVAARIATEPDLELLINNAGLGTLGRFWEADLSGQREMHEVHVTATLELTHAALPLLIARGRGAVINVASVAAFARSPSNVSYCATKAWMLAFTEGLALELGTVGSPVQVQALCPGFTITEFHETMGVSRKTIAKSLWMSAGDVVEASLDGLRKRRIVVIPGWKYRLFVSVLGLLPFPLRMAIQKRSPHTKARMKATPGNLR